MQAYLANRLQLARQYLRLVPFECDSEEGRAAERYRRAAWSLLASVLSRSLTMATMLLSVALTIPYLGTERFGIWMTIAGFVSMLTFLDMGIGNALINHVAKAVAANNKRQLRESISGGLGLLLILAVCISSVLVLIAGFLPWKILVKLQDPALYVELQKSVMLFAVLFGFYIFTSGLQKVFAGLQRAYESHLVVALGQLISIILLFWAAREQIGVFGLLLITFGIQSFVPAILLISLIQNGLFGLKGIRKSALNESRVLLHTGGLFFLLQIGTMIGWGADSFIIASNLGASQVSVYSVVMRLFQFVSIPLAMINTPLWGAYADAYVRGDARFLRITLKKSLIYTFIGGSIGSAALGLSGPWIIEHWTSNALSVSIAIILAMAIWKVLEVTGDAFAMFLNGTAIVRPQVWIVFFFCVFTLPLKLIFIEKMGISGMIWITIIVYLITTVGGYLFLFRGVVLERLGWRVG